LKLLLDSCVSYRVRDALIQMQYDVIWVGDWQQDPGDDAILEYAHAEQRTVVTIDKDFGTLAVFQRMSHSGIVRLVNISLKQQAQMCDEVLKRYGDELQAGAIVTVSKERIRVRPPEQYE
jgi:predicted nuclease of predicted toxin-antitoxin system